MEENEKELMNEIETESEELVEAEITGTDIIETETPVNEPELPAGNIHPADIKPAKSNNKVLIGVIVFLGLVIVGLIVFLIISLSNKDKDKDTNSTTTENTDVISATPGKPDFDVSVKIGEYKNLSADYSVNEVTEEDIEGELDYFISTIDDVKVDITDRPLEEGDFVVIDYVGTIDGVVFDGGSATGVEIQLGSAGFIAGFEDGIIGNKVNDSLSLDLTFPDPYNNNPDYSGKAVNFLVNINEAYEYVTPDLTDEIINEYTGLANLEELKTEIRKELEAYETQSAESAFKLDIIRQVIDNSTFTGQIEEEIAYEENSALEYYDSIAAQYGMDSGASLYQYAYGVTSEEFYAMAHEEAEMSIKYTHVLDEIAKAEGFTVSEEELENAFQEYYIDYLGFTSREEANEYYSDEEINLALETYVLQGKAENAIFDTAIKNTK